MKYLIWLLVIVLVLIGGTAVVGRLLAPFAGFFGATPTVAGNRAESSNELPTAEEMSKAPESVREKARRKSWAEGDTIYAIQISKKISGGRSIITAEVEYTPARNPEVYWIGISRKYSWIQIGDVTLNPFAIDGAADLDSTLKSWSDNSGGLGRSATKRLRSLPASERVISGKGHIVKLSFRLTNGIAGTTSEWRRLYLLGMTNQSFNNGPQFWGSLQADPQEFSHWDANLFIPATADKQ